VSGPRIKLDNGRVCMLMMRGGDANHRGGAHAIDEKVQENRDLNKRI